MLARVPKVTAVVELCPRRARVYAWDHAPGTATRVIDVGRVVAWLFALLACRRPRYALGLVVAIAVGALLAIEIGAPLVNHEVGDAGTGSPFAFAFIGPSRIAPRTMLTLIEATLAAVASRVAFARGARLRPEDDAARAWDRAGLRFLFVAVLSGLLVAFDVLLARLVRDP